MSALYQDYFIPPDGGLRKVEDHPHWTGYVNREPTFGGRRIVTGRQLVGEGDVLMYDWSAVGGRKFLGGDGH